MSTLNHTPLSDQFQDFKSSPLMPQIPESFSGSGIAYRNRYDRGKQYFNNLIPSFNELAEAIRCLGYYLFKRNDSELVNDPHTRADLMMEVVCKSAEMHSWDVSKDDVSRIYQSVLNSAFWEPADPKKQKRTLKYHDRLQQDTRRKVETLYHEHIKKFKKEPSIYWIHKQGRLHFNTIKKYLPEIKRKAERFEQAQHVTSLRECTGPVAEQLQKQVEVVTDLLSRAWELLLMVGNQERLERKQLQGSQEAEKQGCEYSCEAAEPSTGQAVSVSEQPYSKNHSFLSSVFKLDLNKITSRSDFDREVKKVFHIVAPETLRRCWNQSLGSSELYSQPAVQIQPESKIETQVIKSSKDHPAAQYRYEPSLTDLFGHLLRPENNPSGLNWRIV